MSTDHAPKAGRREWLGLAVLALPTMLLSLDISVLFLALPHLSADLGANSTQQLWITDVYGFMTAGFLVTMGNLGDRVGRRRLLLIGGTLFAAASVFAAYAPSAEMLIVARALMGIAGATLLPSTLSLVAHMFTDPKQFGTAMAAWTAAFMAGVALGPVVGGAMLATAWWGSVFLLALPVMAVLLATAPKLLPEFRSPEAGRLDLVSVVLSLAAALPVIYGLKELARTGWAATSVLAVVVGVGFGVAFVRRQKTLASPLLDVRLFANPTFRAAVLIGLLVAVLQSGTGLLANLFLQVGEGLSPLEAGLWLVIPALALVLAITLTPKATRTFRPGYVLAAGMGIAVLGQLVLTQVGTGAGIAVLMVGLSVVYFGVGPVGAVVNQLAIGAAPPEKAGSAGALVGTGGEFGVAFGVAALGSIGTAVYTAQVEVPTAVSGELAATAEESVSGAAAVAGQLSQPVAGDLLASAREAFTGGLSAVAAVSAVLFVGLAILAGRALRHEGPVGHGHGHGHEDTHEDAHPAPAEDENENATDRAA